MPKGGEVVHKHKQSQTGSFLVITEKQFFGPAQEAKSRTRPPGPEGGALRLNQAGLPAISPTNLIRLRSVGT